MAPLRTGQDGAGTRLRALRAGDDAALDVLFADPDTVRWNPGPTSVDVAGWLTGNAATERDFRTWAVTDGADDLLGLVSVFSIDDRTRTAEIGFRTLPAARGRGVARAAVRLALAWARDERAVGRVVLHHAVGNVASCRVATACGFALVRTLPANYRYGDGQLHDEHLHTRDLGPAANA